MRAVVVRAVGDPRALRCEDVPDPQPGLGQMLIRVAAAGVNFMDTGARRFGPAGGSVPFIPGVEGAGEVMSVGPDVTTYQPGDRVAWVYAQGSYAEQVVFAEDSAVPIPDGIPTDVAAAVMMQGLTAHGFATEVYPVRAGDIAVVHAAAGGVGRFLTQLITARGGSVLGVVSRSEKVQAAEDAGAQQVIISPDGHFANQVMQMTGGAGVNVVFDGNGAKTFRDSLLSLRRHGTMLYFGPFIGAVPTIKVTDLPNSIKLCYPTFRDHIPTRATLHEHSADLFGLLAAGVLQPAIDRRYPLDQAHQAHTDIESRTTTGKTLLIPGAADSLTRRAGV